MELGLDLTIRQPPLQLFDVRPDPGEQYSVDDRGTGAGILPELRADVGREHHRNVRADFRQNFPHPHLMRRVAVGMKEGDRNRLHVFGGESPSGLANASLVQRNPYGAIRPDTARNSEAAAPGHQRPGLGIVEVVEVGTGLVRNFEHVPEALGRKQSRFRSAALDNGIGGHGGAMHGKGELARLNSERGERLVDTGDASLRGIRGDGGHLGSQDLAGDLLNQDDIGERATDIHADAVLGL